MCIRDSFKLGWFEWGVMGVASLFKFGWVLHGLNIYPPFHAFRYWASYAVSLSMDGHILWLAIAGFRNDLVLQRRHIRICLLVVIGFIAIAATATELIGFPSSVEATIRHLMIVPLLIWMIMWLTKLDLNKLLAKTPPPSDAASQNVSPKDQATHARLIHIMEAEAAYTDHGLTIRRLAERVGVPEHRLRILINQTMGYRNFSEFLNGYRLSYAKRVMADLEQARLPILTIAMDAGYQTLSTFNRAFKKAECETPSAFRERALNGAVSRKGK